MVGMLLRGAALAAGALVAFPVSPHAHEVPARVVVLAFLKPEGDRLRLVVRVPLESIRDVLFPLKEQDNLDIPATERLMPDAARLWLAGYVDIRENGRPLEDPDIVGTRISLPVDRSFETFDRAVARATGPPLPPETDIHWRQAMLDVLIEYPIESERSRFSIDPELAHLGIRTLTVLRFITPDGDERLLQYVGNPGLVHLDPGWHQAAWNFVKLGFEHILDGIDHLLFVFCLVIPFRRLRPLIVIVTSFTVAHSITLGIAAMGHAPSALWFPPLVETLIALSIVYMALENIVGPRLERRWLVAFGFGLIHGFGFSFALAESMQFAGRHLATSLLAFNVGVELGQILVLLIAVPLLGLLFRYVLAEKIGTILLSAIVAHTAWHWMLDRFGELSEYSFAWPALDAAFALAAMRGLMFALVIVGVLWALWEMANRLGTIRKTRHPADPG